MKTLFVLLLLLCGTAEAACVAVGPSSAGAADGTSWTNRRNNLPATLTRGNTYYLMDGSYGSYAFNTAESGTTRIIIKKAQSYDYGRSSDGCSNDISAGWNAATMGAGQAAFTNWTTSSTAGYVTWDGNGRSTLQGCGTAPMTNAAASDCGIKVTIPNGGMDIGTNASGANRSDGWTLRYTEFAGPGDLAGISGHAFIWFKDGANAFVLEHSWWYNSACDFLKIPWTTSADVHLTHFKQNFSQSSCHGQFWEAEVENSNVSFYNNILQDIQGTAAFAFITSSTIDNFNVYNNILMRTSGSSRPGFSNGIFACINAGTVCTNIRFIGNSIINYDCDSAGACGILDENGGGSYTMQNNIFYNTLDIGCSLGGSSMTCDHNSFLNSGTNPCSCSTSTVVTSGAPSPFINWSSSTPDFRLTGNNTNSNGGTTLSSPYDLDARGRPRGADGTWDKGAYEFISSPAAPTNPRLQ